MNDRQLKVTFCDKKTEGEFESLKEGKFEDKQLYEFIGRAIKDLKTNPMCGIKIQKKLWPKEYCQKYHGGKSEKSGKRIFVQNWQRQSGESAGLGRWV